MMARFGATMAPAQRRVSAARYGRFDDVGWRRRCSSYGDMRAREALADSSEL